MRRGVLLVGVWVAGVVIAVSLAFAAVARVANGVAPNDVAHLSKTQVDNELTGGTTPSPRGSTSPTSRATTTTTTKPGSRPTSTSTTSSTRSTSTWVWTTPTTRGTALTAPPVTAWSNSSDPTTPTTATTVAQPPPVVPHNTVTTSQGGTIYTRCTGPETIAYVAAVPKAGYARTVDIESPNGVQQTFANGQHVSNIQAECSNGIVHAEVEEEVTDQ